MTGKTSIEWTHQPGFKGASWNPTVGCTRVSEGCSQCYAFALHDKRFKGNRDAARAAGYQLKGGRLAGLYEAQQARADGVKLPLSKQYDQPFSTVQLLPDRLGVPVRTRTPTCYFVDSMADLFHENVPDDFLFAVFGRMVAAQQHRFLILTKRPERMQRFVSHALDGHPELAHKWPVPNIWLGTSVEDQRSADERIPHLLATPAAVRFLSCEPLLGPVDLNGALANCGWCGHHHGDRHDHACACGGAGLDYQPAIDWVIVGGESGPRARPMDLAWARSLVAQCRAAGVAPFVKQLGAEAYEEASNEREENGVAFLPMRESHGRDMAEWPEDLRTREFPTAVLA